MVNDFTSNGQVKNKHTPLKGRYLFKFRPITQRLRRGSNCYQQRSLMTLTPGLLGKHYMRGVSEEFQTNTVTTTTTTTTTTTIVVVANKTFFSDEWQTCSLTLMRFVTSTKHPFVQNILSAFGNKWTHVILLPRVLNFLPSDLRSAPRVILVWNTRLLRKFILRSNTICCLSVLSLILLGQIIH